MSETETIPTKFPRHDVQMIDTFIKKGVFISRSDFVRQATREKIKEVTTMTSDFEVMVRQMHQKGDFDSLEGKVLAHIFLEKQCKETDFNAAEQLVLRRLLRHPFGLLHKKAGTILLTENGLSVARGYLKGLAFAETLSG